jgi:hypothetical protein
MSREKVAVFEGHMGIIFPVNKKRNTRSVQYPLAEKRELEGILKPFFKTKYAKSVRPSHGSNILPPTMSIIATTAP